MDDKTTKLLDSIDVKMIGTRFRVKASIFDDGVHPKSIMVAVDDLLEHGFTLKFFKTIEKVEDFLKLLKAAT